MAEITEQFIRDELNKKYQNQKVGYGNYSIECEVREIVRKFYNNQKDYTVRTDTNWSCYVCYKGYSFMRVNTRRAKGQTHHSWWGTSADYAFKDFDVKFLNCCLDMVKFREQIDAQEAQKEIDKLGDTLKAKELYEYAMREFALSKEEARKLIAFASKEYYNIMG